MMKRKKEVVEVRFPVANLGSFLQGLGWLVGRRVSDTECADVTAGVSPTDVAADRWHRFRVPGRKRVLSLAAARESPVAEIVVVRTTVSRSDESAIRLLKEICWQFRWSEPDAAPVAVPDGGD